MKIIIISVLLLITLLLSGVGDDTILKDIGDLSSEEITKAVREAKKDSLTSQQDFEELVSEMEKISGLFNLYRNLDDGTVYLEIKPEQLDKNFLLTLTRQSGDAYYFDASAMMWSYPVHFHRINKRIQIRQDNLLFRSSDPALDKALKNSISPSLIASSEITGKPHKVTGAVLIKAADLFLKDLPSVEYYTDRWQTKYSYDQENSYFNYVKSFPENTELEVFLHYKSNSYPDVFTLSDSRSMMHRYHYSLSLIPDTEFHPRPADDRIGFFTTTYQDYTDLSTETPYIRYINRWNLEKEDPDASSSKARNPIVFWLENT
ncbi:MAG: DUF5117 domain-containing protein, partial [Candidatus Cloacimonetes bacterium]|nr:DUF5117 domain-containing protein [Candidatus Cloacimonadota bacterium]